MTAPIDKQPADPSPQVAAARRPGSGASRLPPAGATLSGGARRGGAFVSLRHRDFRLLTIGLVVAVTGYWALFVAQGWLVVQLTDSKFVLGLVNACLSLPFLFVALPAGVLADRVNRQKLMTVTRLLAAAFMLLLAVLTYLDLVEIWSLALLVFLTGCAFSFDLPTRQSLAPELVEPDEVTNAIAVNQLTFQGTSVLGPAIGGFALDFFGAGGAFLLTALGNVFLVAMVLRMRFPTKAAAAVRRSVVSEIREGLAYVFRHPILQPLVILGSCISLFGQPYQAFLPAIAKNTFEGGPRLLSGLYTASGLGSIFGGLAIAAAGEVRHKGRVLLPAIGIFGVCVVIVGHLGVLPPLLALLVLIGLVNSVGGTMNNTIMVTTAPPELRGRVMSINVLSFGLSPLGSMVLGALADLTSIATALTIGGALLVIAVVLTALTRRKLRQLA